MSWVGAAADWETVINPVTFMPVFVLRIRGRRTKIEVSRESIQDGEFNYNELMFKLLTEDDLTPDQIADATHALKQRLSVIAIP